MALLLISLHQICVSVFLLPITTQSFQSCYGVLHKTMFSSHKALFISASQQRNHPGSATAQTKAQTPSRWNMHSREAALWVPSLWMPYVDIRSELVKSRTFLFVAHKEMEKRKKAAVLNAVSYTLFCCPKKDLSPQTIRNWFQAQVWEKNITADQIQVKNDNTERPQLFPAPAQ